MVDLLYPLRCAGCGQFGMVICPDCANGLRRATGAGRCQFCAAGWDGDGNCPRCFLMHELEGVRAACEMTGVARSLVHALKYRHYRAAAPIMATFMAPLVEGLDVQEVFAVPLHRSRIKERGFNQSQLLMERAGWTASGGLVRTRRTEQQVGQRMGERRSNVAGAFAFRGARLDGLTVALVDDVVTTGATVVECARVLKDAGASKVWVVAFARASYKCETEEPIAD